MNSFSCSRHWQSRFRFALRWLASAFVLSSLCACQTAGPMNPVNLSEPGWSVRQGQAVWQMPGNRPALAGEVVFALNTDGRCFVEFSKPPFPLVRAECGGPRWEIEFPPQKRHYAGGGLPTARLAWLQVCSGLSNRQVAPPWRFERRSDGSWRLDNTRSKETVEGFLEP